MRVLLFKVIIIFSLCTMTASAVVVGTVNELVIAVNNANAGGDKLIECENGTYLLASLLHIIADSITVRSLSGNRDSVTIRGQGMTGGVSHVFLVQGSDFSVYDMAIGWVANHAIQIQGELNADRPHISNARFVDTYEQMLKVSAGGAEYCDGGIVENCLFEYTAGIGPQYYIGGIDCHRSRNWIVRNCVFKYIRSPSGSIAEHAVHFWNNSENTIAECNWIINCDRGIGFGLGSSLHIGGIIRNNIIYHDTTEGFADVGIAIETCPDCQIYNNTIYHEHTYANAIEYRFAATTNAYIANNLTNKNIQARNGATGTDTSNITTAQSSWFISVPTGDLHLAFAVPTVVDAGIAITGLTHDFDGDPRPQGAGFDIGADEYTGTGIDNDQRGRTPGTRYFMNVWPNPFNLRTQIRFTIQDSRCTKENLRVGVFDASGRLVRSFDPESCIPGLAPRSGAGMDHVSTISWYGTDQANRQLPCGVYFVVLQTPSHKRVEQVVLLR